MEMMMGNTHNNYFVKKARRFFSFLIAVVFVITTVLVQQVFAVRPDSLKDVITDSRPSTAANHTITLNQSTSGDFSVGDTLVLTFASGFDTSGFASTDALDYDITVNGVEETIVDSSDACAGDTIEITTVAADVFTFTACGTYGGEAAGVVIVIEIGTHATSGGTGNTQITNSTAAAYNLAVDSTDEDSQDTIIVVTSAVTVSATIDEVLTLTVAGTSTATCTTTGGTEIDTSGSAVTIPFATISTEAFYDACQSLTVTTNAGGGYTVTVYTVAGLDSGANAFAVGSGDGSATLTTPNTWATATNNGYAVCMDDSTGDAAATANAGWDTAAEQCGGAGQKFELVADLSVPDSPSTIMSSAAGIVGDISLVGWRISADGAQAAGAYTGTADYITTGTF